MILELCAYSYVDTQTGVMRIEKYKSSEAATVEQVLLLGGETGRLPLVCAAIKVLLLQDR